MASHRQTNTERALALIQVDFSRVHFRPRPTRLAVAGICSIIGSLGADAALVALGTAIFPATKGYEHFRFGDYGKLTTIGVVVACIAWPIVTRISPLPRWLFFRLALSVTVILWVPDVWIWLKGQSTEAVSVLATMHVAIALVTYNALVHLAPATRTGGADARSLQAT